jgi:MoxR-like ATPase
MKALLGAEELAALRAAAAGIYIDEQIERYIVSIVAATRPTREKAEGGKAAAGKGRTARQRVEGADKYIVLGASPRASIALHRCAKIRALLDGSGFVRPEDVKASALPVLRHRLVLSFEAEADGLDADAVIERVLAAVPAP